MVSKLQLFVLALYLGHVCTAPESRRLSTTKKCFCRLKSLVKNHSNVEKMAVDLYNDGYYRDALQYFDKAINTKKTNPKYFAERGDCHLKLDKLDDGISDHEEAALLTGKRGEYQIRLCQVLIQYDRLDRAKTELKELDHVTLMNMAVELREQSEYDKALMVLDEAILKQPLERYYRVRGDLLRTLNRLDDVVSNYREAVSLPQYYINGSSRNELIQALFDTENFDDAMKEMDPLEEIELLRHGDRFRLDKKYKEAICFYTVLIKKNPLEKYYRIKGICHLEMDDPLSAIVTFRDATSLLDQYADSETRVLLIETLLSIPNHASDAVQEMHLLKYDKLMELGNKYYANGQLENARLVFTVAIEDYSYEICYRSRGLCYLDSGNLEKAIDDFRAAVSLPPDLRDGLTDLILIKTLLDSEMFPDAKAESTVQLPASQNSSYYVPIKRLERVNKAAAEMTRLRDSEILELGDTYFKRGKFEGAVCCYSVAITRRPSDPKLYTLRARCFIQMNDLDAAALSDFQKQINHDPEFYDKGKINEHSQILLIAELFNLGKMQRGEEKMHSLNPWQLVRLGEELSERQLFIVAEQAYSLAVEKGPSNSVVFYEKRAEFFRQRGLWHNAISDYQEALKINPSGINYLVELVELCLKNNQYPKAKEFLEEHHHKFKFATKEDAERIQIARQLIVKREQEEEEARQRKIREEMERAEQERQRRIQEERRRAELARQQAEEEERRRRRQRQRDNDAAIAAAAAAAVVISSSTSSACGGGGGCGGGGC